MKAKIQALSHQVEFINSKDKFTASAFWATNSMSCLSFAVSPEMLMLLSGRFMPLSDLTFEPPSFACSILTFSSSGDTSSIIPSTLPSSNKMGSPTCTSAKISGRVHGICAGSKRAPLSSYFANSPGRESL